VLKVARQVQAVHRRFSKQGALCPSVHQQCDRLAIDPRIGEQHVASRFERHLRNFDQPAGSRDARRPDIAGASRKPEQHKQDRYKPDHRGSRFLFLNFLQSGRRQWCRMDWAISPMIAK
jgi:hypothetical protein